MTTTREDKVPINLDGFSPVMVPAGGWQFSRGVAGQLNFLSTAAVMVQLSFDLH